MSDDEGESLVPGSTPRSKAPRFTWNSVYEDTFFRSLCESIQLGFKEHQSFKAGAWERAALALRDKHNAYPEKSHLINKADNARKKFRLWRSLREDPEFLYNPATRTVTASDDAWKRHIQKEPLSKALRGRPFEHEEYLEILFPDVIGSGGAPKRIMRPRRKTQTSASGDADGDASMLDPQMHDASQFVHDASQDHVALQHLQSSGPVVAPMGGMNMSSGVASSVLTPPDDVNSNSLARKRPSGEISQQQQQLQKRRGRPPRFSGVTPTSSSNTLGGSAPSTSLLPQHAAATATTPQSVQPIHPSFQNLALNTSSSGGGSPSVHECFILLAEALRSSRPDPPPPKWQEQAVEILFRDFPDEDPDLQLKIAEKALTDENKAMVFVKMTPHLRSHWVGRLRDVHLRTQANGGGPGVGGGLGRAIDEAS
ncbi:Myb/SANT-like DNA-binding domain-domain-containing protein [Microdochium bolleyi]|uniref:Myb/SANT-like DNA-binding domain-domain-containing protein n=1 Tax=Microdochium bolleyi TaxID=196109 RepID=A0A136IWF6_9PEZI|nr:Myb/SANT-like DNA-binding domain-domain-containing protein [Microdochium bolleyi]